MIVMMQFAMLVVVTMFAAALAAALDWLLLRTAFALMRPATQRISVKTELVHGTKQLARAFASYR